MSNVVKLGERRPLEQERIVCRTDTWNVGEGVPARWITTLGVVEALASGAVRIVGDALDTRLSLDDARVLAQAIFEAAMQSECSANEQPGADQYFVESEKPGAVVVKRYGYTREYRLIRTRRSQCVACGAWATGPMWRGENSNISIHDACLVRPAKGVSLVKEPA